MIVFVSGAAGLIGGALVSELIERGHGVIALVHNETVIRCNDNQVISSTQYDGSVPNAGEVVVLKGDVTSPSLGIASNDLSVMRASVDCVVHCAALVRFDADFQDLRSVNVDGTLNLARCFPEARYVQVSTAYTCGAVDGPITEVLPLAVGSFSNGYEESKATAELELVAVRPDAIIARPSIVVGDFQTGAIRTFDALYRAFKIIAEGRVKALPVAPNASLNFVPINFVVAGLADLASCDSDEPEVVHLTARKGVPARRFLELVRSVTGSDRPKAVLPEALPEPSGRLTRSLGPYLPYFTRNPEFDTSKADRFLASPVPDMEEAALLRQIRYALERKRV